jgi:signal peptidase II
MPALMAFSIVLLDRITKIQIRHSLSDFDAIPVIPGWLRIVHTENPGAAFGMLADGNPLLRSVILIGVSTGVLLFVGWALWSHSASFSSLLTRIGLSMIFGGALGNLYDRIIHGTVTDFIEVYHGGWSFPAFNVADSAITVGACLLLLDLLWPRREIKHASEIN